MRALFFSVSLLLGACAAVTGTNTSYCMGPGGVYAVNGACYAGDRPLAAADLPPCAPSKSGHDNYRAPCRKGADTAPQTGAPIPEGGAAVSPDAPPAKPEANPPEPASIPDTAENEAVRAAQILLGALGLDAGEPTGKMDPRTESAIRGFQSRMGLPEDGRISANLLRILRQAVTAGTPAPKQEPAPEPTVPSKRLWTGSGFVVSRDGHILTNRHVVDGCTTVLAGTAKDLERVDIVTADESNDLALLRMPNWQGNVALFRDGMNIRPGDDIVVLGYPLSDILALEPHVTTGTVSALAGLRNDIRFLQISAPVQPGNSGGPVLDRQGRIIAIVASKLDSVRMTDSTSRPLQSVNFAIRSSLARAFLDANGIKYTLAENATDKATADIGDMVRPVTVRIECWQ